MERDNILYIIRRKLQVQAHKIIPDKILSKIYYRIVLHKGLSLDKPKSFNEKLQWLKLYYYPYQDKVVNATDKYAVRKYIKDKGFEDLLTPLIGVWNSTDDIPWDALPDQFVLKCNHGCAYNILCHNKKTFDINNASRQLKKWLKEDFGAFNVEIHYSQIKEHIVLCEEYLGASITDYKFFCFNGEPLFLYVSDDLIHDRQARIGYFKMDGSKLPLKRKEYADLSDVVFPPFYDEMVNVAKNLAKDFPFVRVDFFIANDRYYFAELTFTPGGCMNVFDPEEYDLQWGRLLDISEVMKQYGKK